MSAPAKTTPSNLASRIVRRLRRVPAEVGKLAYRTGLRSTEGLTLPDFLGIGFMKCGTTWVYENLRIHPEIYMSADKEVRYFNGSAFWGSLADYAALFRGKGERVAGEFSPPYAWLPEGRIAFIRRVMPDARLVAMLRDPVARDWSRATHLLTERGTPVEQVGDDEVMDLLTRGSSLNHGGYTGVLDRWTRHFPADRLFVGLYEHIKERPQDLLTRLFRFLDVSTDVDWEAYPLRKVIVPPVGERYADFNQGRGVVTDDHRPSGRYFPERFRDALTERYEAELRELHHRFGDEILVWESARRVLGERSATPA